VLVNELMRVSRSSMRCIKASSSLAISRSRRGGAGSRCVQPGAWPVRPFQPRHRREPVASFLIARLGSGRTRAVATAPGRGIPCSRSGKSPGRAPQGRLASNFRTLAVFGPAHETLMKQFPS
jgi:hypothetical protein